MVTPRGLGIETHFPQDEMTLPPSMFERFGRHMPVPASDGEVVQYVTKATSKHATAGKSSKGTL